MIDRMLGATVSICGAGDYYRAGGNLDAMRTIASEAAAQLRREGRNPYVIPVGASNALGTWGYIDAVEELRAQFRLDEGEVLPFDHIVMTTGSAGSAAGVAIGVHLSQLDVAVHAVCVNGSVDEKYAEIGAIGEEMGCWERGEGEAIARRIIRIYPGTGRGYGVSTQVEHATPARTPSRPHALTTSRPHALAPSWPPTPSRSPARGRPPSQAELEFAARVGPASGVLLDPIYTGKGLYYFCEAAKNSPATFKSARVLFWHTGGLFSMWSKAAELQPLLPEGQVRRLRLPRYAPPKELF